MKTDNIIRMEGMDEKSLVYLQDGVVIDRPENLDTLEQEKGTGFFFRIHPRHLINLSFLSKINLGENPSVEMGDGSVITVQKGKQTELLKYFENYFNQK